MWYQTYNNFGEIVFAKQWSEDKAHPTLTAHCFYCRAPIPDSEPEFERFTESDGNGHWVFY